MAAGCQRGLTSVRDNIVEGCLTPGTEAQH
jgi:hypothetical protein